MMPLEIAQKELEDSIITTELAIRQLLASMKRLQSAQNASSFGFFILSTNYDVNEFSFDKVERNRTLSLALNMRDQMKSYESHLRNKK